MSQPFVVPAHNIQVVLSMLFNYAYSKEYMEGIGYNKEYCDDDLVFDISMAIIMLGGSLPTKSDYNELN